MSKSQEKRQLFTRRTLFKTLTGLFAFIPAAKYLAAISPAFAVYECEETVCNPYSPPQWDCMDPECRGYNTWHQLYGCTDAHTGAFCFNVWTDSGQKC